MRKNSKEKEGEKIVLLSETSERSWFVFEGIRRETQREYERDRESK